MIHTVPTPLPPSPAVVYDERFVPALFGPWAARLCGLADVQPGEHVLDVGCGTGVLAVAAAERAGTTGRVAGLDPSDEMLSVARSKDSRVRWHRGRAEDLPFVPGSFDRVLSQFALMFFDDRPAALREMSRVLRPGGRLVVAVCDAVDHSPGYAVLTELLHRLFGPTVADAFRAPFALGDREGLRSVAEQAGLQHVEVRRLDGTVRFASIADLVSTERACAWTLGGVLDDDQFDRLREAAEESLAPFVTTDGAVEFGMPAVCLVSDRGRSRPDQ